MLPFGVRAIALTAAPSLSPSMRSAEAVKLAGNSRSDIFRAVLIAGELLQIYGTTGR